MSSIGSVILLIVLVQLSQSISVSPKLDFVASNEDAVTKRKSSPKIQGVRVVVDTSQLKKSIESKSVESEENDDDYESNEEPPKKGRITKKTVGVRTDITVELSDENGDDNGSSNQTRKLKNKSANGVVDKLDDNDDDDEDQDKKVPVIKGSSTGGGAKLDRPTNNDEPEQQKWHVHNVPIIHGSDHAQTGGASVDRWEHRIAPIGGVWTTEPNYYYKPRARTNIAGYKPSNQPWQPCQCHQSNWKPSALKPRTFVIPLDRSRSNVNDKLEYPFSGSTSDEY